MMAQDPGQEPVIFVVDDDPSVRRALDNLLRSNGFRVQAFASVEEYRESEPPDAPACMVLDVRMPGQSGLEFQREANEAGPQIPIIFVTGHGDIPMSVGAMKAGAIEFLTKPFHDQELMSAIRLGLEKDRARRRDNEVLATLRARYETLTAREREVMAAVVVGKMNKQIAADMSLSEISVKVHRGQVMRKMKAASLAELVRIADKLGVTSPL
jgi:FixJ family two-component response regulator